MYESTIPLDLGLHIPHETWLGAARSIGPDLWGATGIREGRKCGQDHQRVDDLQFGPRHFKEQRGRADEQSGGSPVKNLGAI